MSDRDSERLVPWFCANRVAIQPPDPSQTGVQAARGPYTSAGYVDEIHHWQGGRR